jgi:hypothetical protein
VTIDPKAILETTFGEAIDLPEEASQPEISKGAVKRSLDDPRASRICFATVHQGALKRGSGKYAGAFSVPFRETIYPLFHEMTGFDLYYSRDYGNWWRSIRTTEEFETIERGIRDNQELVFLRDQLALSVALAENLTPEGRRTPVGDLEYRAKYRRDVNAVRELVKQCGATISRLPFYQDVEAICAVPPRPDKDFDLPSTIAARLAKEREIPDITGSLQWSGKKPSLKNEPVESKWGALEKVGLSARKKLEGGTILLIDDLYQSGITMQFVAMILLRAGAKRIVGLSFVKSRGNRDNTP